MSDRTSGPTGRPKIPECASIEELAEFWETHDITDFEDQLEEVTEPVFELRRVSRVRPDDPSPAS
jgi:hypothetical protein